MSLWVQPFISCQTQAAFVECRATIYGSMSMNWHPILSLALFHSYTKHYRNRLCLVDPMVTNRSRIVTNAHFSWLPKKCNSVHCMAQSVQNVLWHSTQLSEWVRCHHGDLAFQVDDDDDDNDNDNNGNVVDCHPYILVLDILVISSVLARLAPFERSNISN